MKKLRSLLVVLFICLGLVNNVVFADKNDSNDDSFEVIYCVGENVGFYHFNEKYLPNLDTLENIFLNPVACGVCAGIVNTLLYRLDVFPNLLVALLSIVFEVVIFQKYCQKNIDKKGLSVNKRACVTAISLSVTLYCLNYLVNRDMGATE